MGIHCLRVFAIVNSVAMNIGAHISFQIKVLTFPNIYPKRGFLGHMIALLLDF